MTDTGGYYSADEEKQLGIAAKLLAKASSTDSPQEADALRAKAQEIMTKLGVDTATIERRSDAGKAKREEMKLEGGFYLWQRELMRSLAKLNFCMYFLEEYRHKLDKPKRYYEKRSWQSEGDGPIIVTHQKRKRHRLIGRSVNVTWTKSLYEYLSEAIEKALREYIAVPENIGAAANPLYGPHANSFREGMAAELVEKIGEKFRKQLAAAERERHKQAKAAGHDTGRALTLLDVKEQEHAGNYDFLHGEGAWAKLQAERAAEAEENKRAQEAYVKWAKEHPEEAKAEEERRREHERKAWARYRGGTRDYADRKEDKRDYSAYRAGAKAAEKISLEPQVDKRAPVARIGRA